MRRALILWHRWVGLAIAGFLIVSGLTGAVISWDHELDEVLNPHLTEARAEGPALPPLKLAAAIEARDPRVRVSWVPLGLEPGYSYAFGVDPVVDPATGRLFEPGYNQVFLDPATGEELGRRDWGAAWPITSETFVSFLYVLHYSLHVPEIWGIDLWGMWLLGGVAILWTVDCFAGFYLTLPPRRRIAVWGWWARWKPAWQVKTTGSAYRLNFDLHRAFSLWTWALLFILAFTAFSLNLYREVFYPAMSLVSEVTPTPFDLREPRDKHDPIAPAVGYAQVIDQAAAKARARGWDEPAGGAFYSQEYGIFGVGFFHPGDDHGAAGVGPAYLYLDGTDGRLLGAREPWVGTAADLFVQAQFPLHSGRILGLPGRILISVMGLVVAGLSITGVVVWARKRRARLAVRAGMPRAAPAGPLRRHFGLGARRLCLAAALLAAATPAAAQQAAPIELVPVTVTGEKIARPLGETTSSVTVVPAEQVPPAQNRDVYDALRFAPNVTETSENNQPIIRGIDASGGPDSGGGAAFAGSRPRLTVFVDGVPQISNISRGFEPGAFDLERVEVFRGPQSTIQGRNSLAGAIVVRTRDPTFEPEAILEGAVRSERLTYSGGAAVSGPLIEDQLAARLTVEGQNGNNFIRYTDPSVNQARYSREDNATVRGKLLLLPAALPELSAKLTLAHQTEEEPSLPGEAAFPDPLDGRNSSTSFGVERVRSDTAVIEAAYEVADGLRLEFVPSYVNGRFDITTPDRTLEFEETSDQYSGELRAVYDPQGGRTQAVAGIYGFRRTLEQEIEGNFALRADDELSTAAVFGEATRLLWGPFGVILGGRIERERQDRQVDYDFGQAQDFEVNEEESILLPKAGLVYRPESGRFSAALTAQRGYNAGGGSISFLSGTPYSFDTETSWTYELALRSTLLDGRLQLAGNLFYSTIDDYQTNAAGPEGPDDAVVLNAPEARTYGAELEARARPLRLLELLGGLGLLDAEFTEFEDSEQDYGGNDFPGAAPLTAVLGAAADLPLGVRLAADARYVAEYYTAIDNDSEDKGGDYVLVNARAEIGWRGTTLFAFANNLFDEDYYLNRDEDFGFAEIGAPRTLGVGARLEF